MKLRKLDKYAHYWNKEKTDWVIEDKDGFWWIVRGGSEKKEKADIPIKNTNQSSMKVTIERMMLIIVSGFLGISLAVNVVYYLLR